MLPAYKYRARLVRVVDGDTVVLDVDLGMSVTVRETFRLYGINTPETYGVKKDSAEYKAGMLAKERVTALLTPISETDTLMVETFKDSKEKYGRYLARVYCKTSFDLSGITWECVNDILVREGLAKVYLP